MHNRNLENDQFKELLTKIYKKSLKGEINTKEILDELKDELSKIIK
ncbi:MULTISPECIES: hypothetical protein [Niallia]|uniref:Uncharacterized protein n=1 Tax=Niallia alba TaxID=2729105 RepID=A0A7Y0PQD2_9BACI|nr:MULTISPECIES: hypothetical protein [Niallia]NMO79414.1 hypothetical protein [Niallia alba]UTI42718.1 hypothetical protein NKG37_02905 [Niallia sp. RD1]